MAAVSSFNYIWMLVDPKAVTRYARLYCGSLKQTKGANSTASAKNKTCATRIVQLAIGAKYLLFVKKNPASLANVGFFLYFCES